MAAQSGIAPTAELTDAWSAAIADPNTRILKVAISNEQLVPAGIYASTSSDPTSDDALEGDFALFEQDGVAEDTVPAYYAYRLTPPPTSTFLFISYVPDHAPVRAKMLYASTRNTLVRALGDSRIADSLFATSRADLTHASYRAHVAHASASAPLTAREEEMAAIRAAEAASSSDAAAAGGARTGRSMLFGAAGAVDGREEAHEDGEGDGEVRGVLRWSEEAKEAVWRLGESGDEGAIVLLEIDVPNESVALSPSQPSSLADLPNSSPAYIFYRHSAGIVLIYSCPPSSPIKHRLLYSSAVLPLYRVAAPRFSGVTVLKKLETDDVAEITPSWITDELGALAAATPSVAPAADSDEADSAAGSGAATPQTRAPLGDEEEKPKFARPSRPGRRR